MNYEDTFPVNLREFPIELVCGKIRKIAYLGSVPSIFISCCFDYAKLRKGSLISEMMLPLRSIWSGLFKKILSINVAEFLWTRVGLSTVGMR